jgi:23S rRNA (uracil1939-C5)-methyltransferase
VAGGDALAREPSGRVVFVAGALPGERVEAVLVDERRDYARATASAILRASPGRVEPPCPFVASGCGGCDLQHLAPVDQPDWKRAVVVDALTRLGRIPEPLVEAGSALGPWGFRTTVRCAVHEGRAGFRRARSHEVVEVDHCLVAHPLVDEVLRGGRFGDADEVVIRAASSTGERLVVAWPDASGVVLPAELAASVPVVSGGDAEALGSTYVHEVVDGHRFRISAGSFFQTRPDGAAALATTVAELGGAELAGASRVVDAYGGVGLFAALAVPASADVVLVEAEGTAVIDARHNLAGRPGALDVVAARVEQWVPSPADAVIADPARTGLAPGAVAALAATGAEVLVLVSCDAASLGRDARRLGEAGYRFERAVVVDLFPQTHHVEVVSRFVRSKGA